MLTHYLMRVSIVVIAGFSAVSAVAGLGAVFRGAYWPVVIAGCGIELGRYSVVAYAVQQRQNLSRGWLTAIGVVVLGISLLTNAGIFGFLGDSLEASHSKAQKTETDLSSYSEEKTRLEARLVAIDKQVAELPSEFVSGRLKLMLAFADERQQLQSSLKQANEKLKVSRQANHESIDALGPIVVVARTLGTSVDNAIGYMMIGFTLSLDLFALFLTVLVNLHPRRLPAAAEPSIIADTVEALSKSDLTEHIAKEWNFK